MDHGTELEQADRVASAHAAAYDADADQVAVVDGRGTIVAVNAAWRAFTTESANEGGALLEGSNLLAVCDRATGTDALGARTVAAAIRAVLQGEGGEVVVEYSSPTPVGWRSFVCRVTGLAAGGPPLAVVARKDVTLEKRTAGLAAALAGEAGDGAARAAMLAASGRDFAEAVPDYDRLVAVIVQRLAETTGDASALRLHTLDGSRPESFAAHHRDVALTDAMLGAIGRTVRSGRLGLWRPVIAEQRLLRLEIDPEEPGTACSAAHLAFARRWSVRALLGAPLVARGRVLGGVALVRCGDARPFSSADEALLAALADRAALALDNAWLYRTAREELTARRPIEEALRRSEQQFKALVENSPDLIGRFDRTLRHLYVNPAVERATGLPAAAFEGKTSREMGQPEYFVSALEMTLRQVFATGEVRMLEFAFTTPGGPRHYEARLVPVPGPHGGVESVLSIARDNTERWSAEQRLADLHRELLDRDSRLQGLVDRILSDGQRRAAAATELAALTLRERQVLSLVGRGLTNTEIGRTLHLSTGTVKNHVSSLLPKLGVVHRVQAALRAAELGLFQAELAE